MCLYIWIYCRLCRDGLTALAMANTGQYDLLLLDVMIPKMDGFEVCRKIREKDQSQAIIMLTAKSTDEDIINGLNNRSG